MISRSDEIKTLNAYKASLDRATKFIPTWVKVAVAIALGLGHHGRLEAHRRHRRREDRQDAFDVRPEAPVPKSLPPPRSLRRTFMACRFQQRTCYLPASPAPWRRTVPGCSSLLCVILLWPGC